jgi:hypothetical protein
MGDWWSIGLCAGLGTAIGVFLAGALSATRAGLAAAALGGAGAGLAIGLAFFHPAQGVGGIFGGLLGAAGAAVIVRGTLRRGGTVAGTAVLVAGVAIVLAGLAFVPVVGYLEAIVVPALAARLRRRAPERYAGLRTLARD